MAITRHCWRCEIEVPMLEEHEWKVMQPLLQIETEEIKKLREIEGIGLKEALGKHCGPALQYYEEITGFHETNFNAIWHHRNSLLGSDCEKCGKPYRTPRAKLCAACMYKRE